MRPSFPHALPHTRQLSAVLAFSRVFAFGLSTQFKTLVFDTISFGMMYCFPCSNRTKLYQQAHSVCGATYWFSAKGLSVPKGMIIVDDYEGTLRRFLVARKYDMVRKLRHMSGDKYCLGRTMSVIVAILSELA